jgi:hypothetical protein
MEFYALALKECIDCFYDFELNTWGDGICKNNLLPTEGVASLLKNNYEIHRAHIVHVVMDLDEDDSIVFKYEDIWGEQR